MSSIPLTEVLEASSSYGPGIGRRRPLNLLASPYVT